MPCLFLVILLIAMQIWPLINVILVLILNTNVISVCVLCILKNTHCINCNVVDGLMEDCPMKEKEHRK